MSVIVPGNTKKSARFPFKRNRLRCVTENRKKRKRQAVNHGCHCFDRAFLLAGACVCCVKFSEIDVLPLSHPTNSVQGGATISLQIF